MTRRGRFVVYGLVLVFGLVPMMLRGCALYLEPYPALILPAGNSLVEREGHHVPHDQFVLTGVRPDGSEVRLDPGRFFEPIPVTYWVRIVVRRFGLPSTVADQRSQEAKIRESARKHRRAAHQYGVPEILLNLIPGSVWREMAEREHAISRGGSTPETKAWLRRRAAVVGVPEATALRVRQVRTTVHALRDTVIDRRVIGKTTVPIVP